MSGLKSQNDFWVSKSNQVKQHAHEHHRNPNWFRHEKHILIFTFTGRPVFSKYGDENKLSAFIGVISALIANVERLGDALESFTAGDYTFVFHLCGPIYLVSISNTGESVSFLRAQLKLAHSQIISVTGGSINEVLESRPNYDVRQMLTSCSTSPHLLVHEVLPLRLNRHIRAKLTSVLKKHKPRSAALGLILGDGRPAAIVRGKEPVPVTDLHLLINVLTNSQSLRSGEGWSPICLPSRPDDFAFVYAHYLSPSVCLAFVTSGPLDFPSCSEAKTSILATLKAYKPDPPAAPRPGEPRNPLVAQDALEELEFACRYQAWRPSEVEGCGPELLHVFYRSVSTGQCVASAAAPPFAFVDAPHDAPRDTQAQSLFSTQAAADLSPGDDPTTPMSVQSLGTDADEPVPSPAEDADDAELPEDPLVSGGLLKAVARPPPAQALPLPAPLLRVYTHVHAQTHAETPVPPATSNSNAAGPATAPTSNGMLVRPVEASLLHTQYYLLGDDAAVFFTAKQGEYELYVALTPLAGRELALATAHRVLRWVKREEPSLFMP
jgi:hypothetical protein